MDNIEDLLNRGYRYAVSLTHNQDMAKDLVQEACAQIHSNGGPWNVGYFFKTIKNKFIDELRRGKKVQFEPLDNHNHIVGQDQPFDGRMNLTYYLSQLRDEEREVLYLSVVEGYTTKELSNLLEKPQGTILSLIYRAKERLKVFIIKQGKINL